MRGIRVVPEFDTPGHAESWCAGMPEVCPSATCRTPLDVSKAETFAVLDDVLGDAAKLFPDAFVHLGGDEVDTSCWASTPSIRQWLQQRNYTTADAYAYFVSKAAKLARAHEKRPVQWAEVFDQFGATLDKRTIVHVWNCVEINQWVTVSRSQEGRHVYGVSCLTFGFHTGLEAVDERDGGRRERLRLPCERGLRRGFVVFG